MRILFIGGTGNISADCAALLHQRGHDIAVITRGRSPVPPAYQALQADRKSPDQMRAALRQARPDVVINFLGYEVSEVALDYDLCRGMVKQYIFISSASVYAKPPARLPITEESPLANPWWDYAQKKIACEDWLRRAQRESGFPATIVRPSHTYSCRWVPNCVASSSYSFAARLERGEPVFVPDDGRTLWTLTATSDFAVGLAGLAGNPAAIGEAFHITSDEALPWNAIVSEIAAAVGNSSPQIVPVPTDFICSAAPQLTGTLKGDKAHPGVFDNSKLKRFVPGFACRKPFRQGVRESVAWLRAHPEQQNLKPDVDATIDRVLTAWRDAQPPASPRTH